METTVCPKCGAGEITLKGSVYSCSNSTYDKETRQNEGCDFKIWKSMYGAELNEEDVYHLVTDGSITRNDLVSKKTGKAYTATLTLNNETGKLDMSFPDQGGGGNQQEPDENGIIDFGKGYKKDDKVVWKVISQSTITYEEAVALFNGETINKKDMISNAGKPFEVDLIINEEGKIEFIFPE